MNYALLTGAGREVRVPLVGRPTAAELAFDAGFALQTACGGRGICGRCRLRLGEGDYETLTGQPFHVAEGEEREALGCRVRVVGPTARLQIPETSLIEQKAQIHEDYQLPPGAREPLLRRFQVQPPPASLDRPGADLERLMDELRRQGVAPPLQCPLEILRLLPDALRQGGGTVTITLGPAAGGSAVAAIEAGDTTGEPLCALAADIGTTTVVCVLLDLRSGAVLARASRYNQQIRKADDVAARISFCRGPAELDLMQRLIVEETLNPLIHELCDRAGVSPERIARVSAAGNTVMTHLLLGLSPEGIGVAPFAPVARSLPPLPARDIGLDVGAGALLDVIPAMAGYVGGDVTADIYAARLLDREGPVMLLDIGTNGEMALWDGRRLRVAATAAGPAFEGAGVQHGSRAAAGAIEHFFWDDDFYARYKVIGPRAPTGLCGSALIDFLAESARVGLLDRAGRFNLDGLKSSGRYLQVRDDRRQRHGCLIVPADESGRDGPIFITEADIAELLKAKAAISAGVATLLEVSGHTPEELRGLVLAGGFARHIDLKNAVRIGLLPRVPLDRIQVIGNGSLAGAVLAMQDPLAPAAFRRIIGLAETVELNLTPHFADHFADGMLLPEA